MLYSTRSESGTALFQSGFQSTGNQAGGSNPHGDGGLCMKDITIRAQETYRMPNLCCACGEPAGTAKLTARSASRGGRILHLAFPLCDSCAHLYARIHRRRRNTFLIGLGVSLFLCIAAFALSQVLEGNPSPTLDTILGGLVILVPVAGVGALIAPWLIVTLGLDPETRKTFRRVANSAKIKRYDPDVFGKGGHVTLSFNDETFTERFMEMNTGVVLPGRIGDRK